MAASSRPEWSSTGFQTFGLEACVSIFLLLLLFYYYCMLITVCLFSGGPWETSDKENNPIDGSLRCYPPRSQWSSPRIVLPIDQGTSWDTAIWPSCAFWGRGGGAGRGVCFGLCGAFVSVTNSLFCFEEFYILPALSPLTAAGQTNNERRKKTEPFFSRVVFLFVIKSLHSCPRLFTWLFVAYMSSFYLLVRWTTE